MNPEPLNREPDNLSSYGKPMYKVSKTVFFAYGHRLLDYKGKCENLHGHNGRAELILETKALDRSAMVAGK